MDIVGQSNFLQALGWAVLNSLWQMAFLWVLYQVITGLLRKSGSPFKSSLATYFLMTGFVWFLYTFLTIFLNGKLNQDLTTPGFVSLEGNEQLNNWFQQTLPIASLLYLLLLGLPLLHFYRNYRYVQVIRQHGLSKANVDWRLFVQSMSERLGIKKNVKVWVSEFINSPVTIGYIKPVILLPIAAINQLSTQQLEAVLLHELAHIRRYDYFFNLLIRFIQAILYFNPFVNAFVKIIEREREKSCDQLVIQFQYDAHSYASALLELERSGYNSQEFAVAASGRKHDLLHRIESIMGARKNRVVCFNRLASLVGGLLFVIGINALVILGKSVPSENIENSFAIANPLYFFSDNKAQAFEEKMEALITNVVEPAIEKQESLSQINEQVVSKIEPAVKEVEKICQEFKSSSPVYTPNPLATAVAFMDHPPIPELNKLQEAQVKEAINATRKVMEESQWRTVEKELAEVLSEKQKCELKEAYRTELKKMDWEKWENNLRKAYDRVDWEKVNLQLSVAVQNIQIDSLTVVYSKALANLSNVEKELNEMNLDRIPDSEITLEKVGKKKVELRNAIRELRAVRDRKIINL